MSPSDLIEHWRFRNHRVQLAHYDSSRHYARLHLLLGIPSIILSAIVGTTVFAVLAKTSSEQVADGTPGTLVQVLIGAMSVAAAVLTGLQTFLKSSEHAEKHRLAGAKFANLKHRIELLATLPPETEQELKDELIAIENTWEKIRQESPTIPTHIWTRTVKSLSFEDHRMRYSDLGVALDRPG